MESQQDSVICCCIIHIVILIVIPPKCEGIHFEKIAVMFFAMCATRQTFPLNIQTLYSLETSLDGQLFVLCNKTRAKGQEAWRKLLKHWHMRGAEVGQ